MSEKKPPGVPPTAKAVPGYYLDSAVYWPCAQPEDERTLALAVCSHMLGFDQARVIWVWCLIDDWSDLSEFVFVSHAIGRRGITREPREGNPLCLYGCRMLYQIWRAAYLGEFREDPGTPPQIALELEDEADL